MGESRALPGFGQVDLELESGLDVGASGRADREARETRETREPSESVRADAARRARETEASVPPSRVVAQASQASQAPQAPRRSVLPPPRMPPQARYVPNLTPTVAPRVSDRIASDPNAHATRRNMAASVAVAVAGAVAGAPADAGARRATPGEGSTRIVGGRALADLLHGERAPSLPPEAFPTPVPGAPSTPPDRVSLSDQAHEPRTRAWSNVDEQLMAYQSMVPEADDEPQSRPSHPSRPSYGSGQSGASSSHSRASGSGAGSGSGVAARDGRVAAMRELYARGDAEGALALAADISDSLHPGAVAPDVSVVVEAGSSAADSSFDVSDPFGGLIPLEAHDLLESHEAHGARGPLPSFDSGVVESGTVDFELELEPPDDRSEVDSGRGLVEQSTPRSHRDHHDHDAAASSRSREPRIVVPPLAAAVSVIAGADEPQLSLTERHSIPTMLVSMGEVAKLPIDHRAGFLLAHVDGMQTLEEILDVCAMPPAEALELIRKLEQMGVIAFE